MKNIFSKISVMVMIGFAPVITSCDEFLGTEDNPTPAPEVHISGIEITGEGIVDGEVTLVEGTTLQLSASITPLDTKELEIEWSSNKESIVTVSETGLVTAVKKGTATVMVKSKVKSSVYDKLKVKVVGAPIEGLTIIRNDGVEIENREISLLEGDKLTLKYKISPKGSNDTSVIWVSSDPEVASVTDNGLVDALKEGNALITCISKADTDIKDFVTIHVVAAAIPVETVTLDKTSLELNIGTTEVLVATIAPTNATDKTVTWTSSNESVATVDASGKVTAIAEGSATITVTTKDGSKTATCEITVVKSINVNNDPIDQSQADARG